MCIIYIMQVLYIRKYLSKSKFDILICFGVFIVVITIARVITRY